MAIENSLTFSGNLGTATEFLTQRRNGATKNAKSFQSFVASFVAPLRLCVRLLFVVFGRFNQHLNTTRGRQTTDHLRTIDLRHVSAGCMPKLHPEGASWSMNRK